MRLTEKNEIGLRVTRRHLRRTWLTWGLLPLVICLALTVGADSVHAADFSMDTRQLEINFQAIFAIAAMLFLVAFTVDGHWTNSQRLAHHLVTLAQRDGRRVKTDTISEYAAIVNRTVIGSTYALAAAGIAIALSAVAAAIAGLGLYYALLLLSLGGAFQLFVLSRHPYYIQLMTTAAAGQLMPEADE